MFVYLMTRFIFLSMLRKRLISNILSISGVNCLRNRRNDMTLNILELRKLCIPKNIRITLHAAKRLEQHGSVLNVVKNI